VDTATTFQTTTGRPLRVLHVDDEPLHLRVVEDILLAFGHSTTNAGSGREALDRLSRESFDLVLMDVHMPAMSGVEVVQRIRASSGPERATPVIAVTADVISRTPDDYLALGFNNFLAKPVLVNPLMASVMAAVGEQHDSFHAA
jgi:CheY-like chemotaxis protein